MIVRDGIYYGAGLSAAGAALTFVAHPAWSAPLFVLAAFCLYFFRDPERQIPGGPVAVAPADGKVVEILPLADGGHRVSIFLNIFNVHVNRAPVGGVIREVSYHKGKFVAAFHATASEENESNTLRIDSGGSEVVVKQIAGLIARRIVCNKKQGDLVEKGERFGLIKFGSRLDLQLGPEWELSLGKGERVRAGSSIVARRRE